MIITKHGSMAETGSGLFALKAGGWRKMLVSTSALAMALAASPTLGADVTWDGSESGDWSTGANWTNGSAPASGDNAIIDTRLPNAPAITNAPLRSRTITIGNAEGSNGAVSVSGAAGVLNSQYQIVVGMQGTGDLLITGGGSAQTSLSTIIGGLGTGRGTMIIRGAGSKLDSYSGFIVGSAGWGSLRIEDGGLVTMRRSAIFAFEIGTQAGSTGEVVVTGAGSHIETANISVGDYGKGTLILENGGTANPTGLDVGTRAGSEGEVIVRGAGSAFLNGNIHYIGSFGKATVRILDGARMDIAYLNIGVYEGGNGEVIVSGEGSVLHATGQVGSIPAIGIGSKGTGALTVSEGGSVISEHNVELGDDGTGTLRVTGANSSFVMQRSSLNLGYSAQGHGNFTVEQGATASVAQTLNIGYGNGGTGEARVDGAGSVLRLGSNAVIGRQGGGDLFVTNGGVVEIGNRATIGSLADGEGALVVSGEGSRIVAGYGVDVGNAGAGTLTVAESGTVVSKNGVSIGVQESARGVVAIGAGFGADGTLSAAVAPGVIDTLDEATGTRGSVQFFAGDGRLVFNHTATDYRFESPITGDGSIEVHAGTTHLTGDSSGFSGLTTIHGGRLDIDGVLGGTIALNGGGAVGGTGRFAGALSFVPGSFLDADILGDGTSTPLEVGGTVTIAENSRVRVTALNPSESYQDGQTYTILTSGSGITGTFAEAVSQSAFINATLAHSASAVTLTIALVEPTGPGEPGEPPVSGLFPRVASTFNQARTAAAFDLLDQTPGTDALALYNELLMLDEDSARAAFDAASGEVYAALQGAGLRQGLAHGRRLIRQSHASGPEGFSLFGGVVAHDGRVEADRNGGRYDYDGTGFEAGVDWRGSEDRFALGAAWARTDGDLSLSARRSSASTEGWQAGAWARLGAQDSGFSVSAAVAYADTEAKASRRIDLGTQARAASATVDVTAVTAVAELRYAVPVSSGWSVGPVVSVEQGKAELDGFSERGAEALNLSSAGGEDSWAGLGVGGFGRWRGERGFFDAGLRYRAGGRTLSEVPLRLAGAPDAPFAVRAARGEQDAWLVDVSGVYQLGRGWELQGDLSGLEGEDESQFSASVSLKWRF